ncbi:MAG: hypothetical protein JWO08_4564 [Verrucomicrobiaceae bacterium]|nr:hypothetical protein [Verrucomicrobiaceae bacterium]
MTESKEQALNNLSCIRFLLAESSRRRLTILEVEALAFTVIELCECVEADAFALKLIEALETYLHQEFCHDWPGSSSTREDAVLLTHALSGHLWGL